MMPPIPLLVDADPSLATFGLDVDDDLALLFLLGSPEVELLGVTTVFGNSTGALTHLSARRTLESAGCADLLVVRGADSRRDAAGARRAGDTLAASVRAHPGAALLALGPLTNVAAAAADPEFGARLGALVVMGGRLRGDDRGCAGVPGAFSLPGRPAANGRWLRVRRAGACARARSRGRRRAVRARCAGCRRTTSTRAG
jgi:inosine-uridine nucleoside N-ribohydrolase